MQLQQVHIDAIDLGRFAPLLGEERASQLLTTAAQARELLDGRTVWNVNSTAAGGGVAEMLQPLLAYSRGAGVDARWVVIQGDTEFFALTKRLHNKLHGQPGDGGSLGDPEHAHYDEVIARNVEALRDLVRPGDVVLLHDPQTAGLVGAMHDHGAITIWRSHIGADVANDHVDQGWAFLRRYVEQADATVFSRREYVPSWLTGDVHLIPPSIDPFSTKNEELDAATVHAIVAQIGVIGADGERADPLFTRRDGTTDRVTREAVIVREGEPPGPDVQLVVQVSRWDRLKDMAGVMRGFVEYVGSAGGANLALVGPDVRGVTDDPEGPEVLAECTSLWQELPEATRRRIQLVCLPMDDVEENAAMVNAIQRHAAVVVQKSLAEGFGLTVAEAMWKSRPVIGTRVGGIQDQIVDGETGFLLEDPSDLAALGDALRRLLEHPEDATRMGQAARERAIELFLGSRHLTQYAAVFAEMIRERR